MTKNGDAILVFSAGAGIGIVRDLHMLVIALCKIVCKKLTRTIVSNIALSCRMIIDPVRTFSTFICAKRFIFLRRLILSISLGSASVFTSVHAEDQAGAQNALIAAKASKSLTLDLLRLNDGRIVAVGERGHVLLSDDQGKQWRQVMVPTRATLTAIASNADTLIIAGHDSVILRSIDRGEHWSVMNSAPANEKPILDVFFAKTGEAFVVGAYGYFARSQDQGLTWQEQEVAAFDIPEFGFPHLYRLKQLRSGALMVVGEAGFIARSDDLGQSWQRLAFPYQGTLFALVEGKVDSAEQTPPLLVSGMRGHLFRSLDRGISWQELATGVHSGLNDMTLDTTGQVLIGGMDGVVLQGEASAGEFRAQQRANRKGIASLLALSASAILIAGEDGLSNFVLAQSIGDGQMQKQKTKAVQP